MSDALIIQRQCLDGISVIAFNAVGGSTELRGFADLHIGRLRLRILGYPSQRRGNSRTVGLPGKSVSDRDGLLLRYDKCKVHYAAVLALDDGETLRRFSDAAITELDEYLPGWDRP